MWWKSGNDSTGNVKFKTTLTWLFVVCVITLGIQVFSSRSSHQTLISLVKSKVSQVSIFGESRVHWCSNGTGLRGNISVDQTVRSWSSIESELPYVRRGGIIEPTSCKPKHRIAIVIPYRDREAHLKVFLRHTYPILKRQNIRARIILVEQAGKTTFNRAMLLNIGFLEMSKLDATVSCYVLHDVDLYSENDKNPYWCFDQPRLLAVAVNVTGNYKVLYPRYFGGAVVVPAAIFKEVNGLSNVYVGWGGEDDDLQHRIVGAGYTIRRAPPWEARFAKPKHKRDKGNEANPTRFQLINSWRRRWKRDGLNSLEGAYKVLSLTEQRLFTNVTVEVNLNVVRKTLTPKDKSG